MAKITPKGKKVKGTKKKDTITWKNSSAKYKTISVFANNGNDVINFKKSKYKNKLYGQNGNDVIYGGKNNDLIDGGKGNDKLYGYNGNDTIKGGKGNDVINAGEGTNTIYHAKGDGNDTLVISNAGTFNDVKFTAVGNDLKLTTKNKEKITLKDFYKGHSVKYIQVGSSKKSITGYVPKYQISKDSINGQTLNGTAYSDIITVQDGTNGKINSGAGDDIISVKGKNVAINPGKGEDVINILPSADYSTVKLTLNSHEGNTVINGIENTMTGSLLEGITIISDGIFQNFRDYKYVQYSPNGDDLIITMANGAAIFVTDYYKLTQSQRNFAISVSDSSYSDDFEFCSYNPAPYVQERNDMNVSITESKSFFVMSSGENSQNTIDIEGNAWGSYLWLDGENKGYTVNVNKNMNHIYVNNTVKKPHSENTNQINVNASLNEITINSDATTVNLSGTSSSNKINVYGGADIWTVNGRSQDIYVYDNARVSVHTAGDDKIYLYGNRYNYIQVTGNGDKNVYIRSGNIQQENTFDDLLTNVGTTTINYSYANNVDLVFEHYKNEPSIQLKQNASNQCNTDQYAVLKGSFDNDSAMNKLKIKAGKNAAKVSLDGISQFVRMANSYINHNFDFSQDDNGLYAANHRKNAILWGYGSYNDTYSNYDMSDGKVIIKDEGGTDSLTIDDDNIKFFFDMDRNGNITDLYLTTDDNGGDNDFNGCFNNVDDVSYVCIKNATGTGKIESIQNVYGDTFDINKSDVIQSQVAAWLNNHSEYSSVMDAIDKGAGSEDLYYIFYNNQTQYWT